MQLTDVLIHLDQNINKTEKENIIEQLRAIEGVMLQSLTKKESTYF